MNRKIRKFFLTIFTLAVIASVSLPVTSCEETDLLSCDRCSDDAPFSPADGGSCYETQSDCEGAEGTDCVICN